MKKLSKVLAALLALCLVASFFPAAFAGDVTETVVATPQGVTVDGNVTVTNPGKNAKGVQAEKGSATVKGDVTANSAQGAAYGIDENVYADNASVTVEGDVTANSTQGSAFGISEFVNKDSGAISASATVKGDVTANSAQGSAYGIYEVVIANGGASASASVTVEGDVTATGRNADGIAAQAQSNTSGSVPTANVAVTGDVTADRYGIMIGQYKPWAVIDVLVEGTVKGGDGAIYVPNVKDPDNVKLTLWKAEYEEGGNVVVRPEMQEAALQNPLETLEQNILYIIKMDEAVQGQVTLVGTTPSHGFDCAKERTRVDVYGENLGSLICDGTTLEQEDGNYFLVVPKGGGVKLRYPVKVVAAAPAPVVDENIVEVLTTGEGIGLRLLKDGTYVLRLADGLKFYGDYELVDGVPVFTLEDGSTVTAELDENGNYVFTLPYGEGQTTTFTISPNKLAKLTAVLG